MKSHEDLVVWQRGIDFVDAVYLLTDGFPADERYGLSSQLRRAAVSVPANVAEGAGRDSTKDCLRHLSIAQGSLAEITTLLIIVSRRRYAAPGSVQQAQADATEIGRLLSGLQRSLRKRLDG